jgi:hypothetical protein
VTKGFKFSAKFELKDKRHLQNITASVYRLLFYKLSDLRAEVKVINLSSMYPEDKCIRFLQNGSFIPDCMALHMKRLLFIISDVIS